MGYRSGARKANITSKDYLEMLGGKLGFTQGTLHNLCVTAVKSVACDEFPERPIHAERPDRFPSPVV